MEHIIFLYFFFTGCVYASWMWDTEDPFVVNLIKVFWGLAGGWFITPVLIGRAIKQIYKE